VAPGPPWSGAAAEDAPTKTTKGRFWACCLGRVRHGKAPQPRPSHPPPGHPTAHPHQVANRAARLASVSHACYAEFPRGPRPPDCVAAPSDAQYDHKRSATESTGSRLIQRPQARSKVQSVFQRGAQRLHCNRGPSFTLGPALKLQPRRGTHPVRARFSVCGSAARIGKDESGPSSITRPASSKTLCCEGAAELADGKRLQKENCPDRGGARSPSPRLAAVAQPQNHQTNRSGPGQAVSRLGGRATGGRLWNEPTGGPPVVRALPSCILPTSDRGGEVASDRFSWRFQHHG